MTMREEIETTIAALGSANRDSDAAYVALARRYADEIDAPIGPLVLDTLGPKLVTVIDRLYRAAGVGTSAGRRSGATVALPPGVAELEAMRQKRAGAG